jgi:5-methylcytosine-specific restriction protein A
VSVLPRRCLDCRRLVHSGHSRCLLCRVNAERAKTARRPGSKHRAEQQRRRATVAAHVATYGWWCPGWADRPAHYSEDLTADHVHPVGAGGTEDGPLVVRCRLCNSARGTRLSGSQMGPGAPVIAPERITHPPGPGAA